MLRLPIWIFMWLLMIAIKIPTALLGFIMVPLIYRYRHTDYGQLPSWTKPWANPEDWCGRGNGNNSLPLWWIKKFGNTFKQFYRYHAIRNPANGLRSYELLDADIIPEKVRFKTNQEMKRYDVSKVRAGPKRTVWYFAWIGFRAGFEIIHIWNDTNHLNIKFGWRIEPSDSYPDVVRNMGTEDASFASKILPYRKG